MNQRLIGRIAERFNAAHDFPFIKHVAMLCYVGSQSHGTSIPNTEPNGVDDVDLMAVILPPARYLIGLQTFDNWVGQWEELDVVAYSYHRFVRLLSKQNPNVLGTLWLREQDYLLRMSLWDTLAAKRSLFATRAAHASFAGYANGQLQKMTSYTREIHAELMEQEAVLTSAGWSLQDVMDRRSVGMPRNVSVADANRAAERVRHLRAKYHTAYAGEKRRNLILKHGFDLKNAAHLIRLLRMCIEFMQTGEMQVYRTHDAEELKAIKRGDWPLERVQHHATELFAQAQVARDASSLPFEPDYAAISDLVTEAVLGELVSGYLQEHYDPEL